MLTALRTTMLLPVAALSFSAHAGGSFEEVTVQDIKMLSATDYEVTVVPLPSKAGAYKDPYFGSCPTFTVQGTYSRLHSAFLFPSSVTREGHLAALAYLATSKEKKSVINFGWMGAGFVHVNPVTPCLVRSRALELNKDEGVTSVLSYHDAV